MTQKKQVVVSTLHQMKTLLDELTEEQKKYIIEHIAPGLNKNELGMFLYKANKLGLDPITGEIFAQVRVSKNGQRQLVLIVGKDGKARKAMETGQVEWVSVRAIYIKRDKEGNVKRVQEWEGGELWGAEAELKRKGFEKPFKVVVPLAEYRNSSFTYNQLPSTMIKKTALSQVYTLAFPDMFGGVYVPEEVGFVEEAQEATKEQIKALKALNVEIPENLTADQAKELLRQAVTKGEK